MSGVRLHNQHQLCSRHLHRSAWKLQEYKRVWSYFRLTSHKTCRSKYSAFPLDCVQHGVHSVLILHAFHAANQSICPSKHSASLPQPIAAAISALFTLICNRRALISPRSQSGGTFPSPGPPWADSTTTSQIHLRGKHVVRLPPNVDFWRENTDGGLTWIMEEFLGINADARVLYRAKGEGRLNVGNWTPGCQVCCDTEQVQVALLRGSSCSRQNLRSCMAGNCGYTPRI
jgi:hypothetical protein